jgi:hypothetical protein
MEKVVVTNPFVGICHMQVCADKSATDDEILSVCNRENPSGTSNGWSSIVKEGDGAPVVCADDPSRLHILVAC